MQGKPLLPPPQPGENLILNHKPDSPAHQKANNREIDNPVSLVPHQTVGKERIAAIVKGGNGVVDRMVKRPARRIVPGEGNIQEKNAEGFEDQGKPENG